MCPDSHSLNCYLLHIGEVDTFLDDEDANIDVNERTVGELTMTRASWWNYPKSCCLDYRIQCKVVVITCNHRHHVCLSEPCSNHVAKPTIAARSFDIVVY